MKKLLIIISILIFASCVPIVSIPSIDAPIPESSTITYTGYFLYSLQTNEDGSYRIQYWLDEQTIQLNVSVPASNVTIERGKTTNVVFVQYNNNLQTGKYIIYLKNDYQIGQFVN